MSRVALQGLAPSPAAAAIVTLNANELAGLIANGRSDAARDCVTAALNQPAASAEDLFQASRVAQQLGLAAAVLTAVERRADTSAQWRELITLGMSAMNLQAYAEAARILRRATQLNAANAGVYALLGGALFSSGAIKEAERALRGAIALDPRNALAQHTWGSFCLEREDAEGAVKALTIAVAADPAKPLYRVSLGRALIKQERFDEARAVLHAALEDRAARGPALLALGHLHRAQCDHAAALSFYKQAADACATPEAITPYLFHLLASDAHSDADVFAEHKRLARMFEPPGAGAGRHANAPDPARRLKIGFVSADFFEHSVARFVTPLARDLDRQRFELFGIYNNCKNDGATAALRARMDHWFVCYGMRDQCVADWIAAHEIDILIDLSGHSKLHRLGVFALRPAPVQASYLGYPGTTGLAAMDYRITCAALDPPGVAEQSHTETLVRLPGIMAPFQPHGDVAVNDLPHLTGAPFTFACLNPTWRINPAVMTCWGAILRAAPQARMLLGNVDRAMIADHLRNLFAAEGVDAARLDLVGRQSHRDYLKLHHRIDLALDTFPYNGGTTTTYSLWMGAPVVVLEGSRTAARTGAGVLGEAGLHDFIARTPQEYVALALDWAGKPAALQTLRRALRGRVRVADAADQRRLAVEFGDALRAMWARWCAAQG